MPLISLRRVDIVRHLHFFCDAQIDHGERVVVAVKVAAAGISTEHRGVEIVEVQRPRQNPQVMLLIRDGSQTRK
jgi:hypothetical protein